MLYSPIDPNSPRGEFLHQVALIIWDEAGMANRAAFGCVDDVCRRIMRIDKPFGGKTVVLLGNFHQMYLVIRCGSRLQVVDTCIQRSILWPNFVIRRLIQPIWNAEDPVFANFVNAIGDGAGPDVDLSMLAIMNDASTLSAFVFPPIILGQPLTCLKHTLLAPMHVQVNAYNEEILARVEGSAHSYLAADSLKEISGSGIQTPDSSLDYVMCQCPNGLPNHTIVVKTNTVFCLLRNFSLDRGLVKTVHVVVTSVSFRIVTVRIVRENENTDHIKLSDDDILIPRISFTHTLSSGYTLLRCQFPLATAYCTTFNSCQGLNLDYIGVDLTRPVFSHGQLYTALSRIKNRTCAMIRVWPNETSTTNVTYEEILLPQTLILSE